MWLPPSLPHILKEICFHPCLVLQFLFHFVGASWHPLYPLPFCESFNQRSEISKLTESKHRFRQLILKANTGHSRLWANLVYMRSSWRILASYKYNWSSCKVQWTICLYKWSNKPGTVGKWQCYKQFYDVPIYFLHIPEYYCYTIQWQMRRMIWCRTL